VSAAVTAVGTTAEEDTLVLIEMFGEMMAVETLTRVVVEAATIHLVCTIAKIAAESASPVMAGPVVVGLVEPVVELVVEMVVEMVVELVVSYTRVADNSEVAAAVVTTGMSMA
jgi:hypothetical protein